MVNRRPIECSTWDVLLTPVARDSRDDDIKGVPRVANVRISDAHRSTSTIEARSETVYRTLTHAVFDRELLTAI